MKNLTLKNIAKASNGILKNDNSKDIEVDNITIDSREAKEGSLFVSVVGERVDGHSFISQVYEKGALCVLTERELTDVELSYNKPYIIVESTLQALKDIAKFYRQQLDVKIIGITGSVGKTSTKEIISSVLSTKYNVLKTLGNFNNEIGVPLTLFRLREEHEIAVVEMGINHFEEMHRLSDIARPNVSVITNIGICHLENLISRDGIFKAKTEMFDYLSDDAYVILNGDDDKLCNVKEVQGKKPVFYGMDKKFDVYATDVSECTIDGISCKVHINGTVIEENIPIPGIHMVYNAMAATAIGKYYGLTDEEIATGIKNSRTISGRFNVIKKEKLTIIDDCYNANPVSMKASIDVLSKGEGRKVAILGDMFELGEDEVKLHSEIGTYLQGTNIDLTICIGTLASNIKASNKKIVYFESLDGFFNEAGNLIKENDTVLVKASHGMKFAKIVEFLEKNQY